MGFFFWEIWSSVLKGKVNFEGKIQYTFCGRMHGLPRRLFSENESCTIKGGRHTDW